MVARGISLASEGGVDEEVHEEVRAAPARRSGAQLGGLHPQLGGGGDALGLAFSVGAALADGLEQKLDPERGRAQRAREDGVRRLRLQELPAVAQR